MALRNTALFYPNQIQKLQTQFQVKSNEVVEFELELV